jgi:hypothetical protein
MSLDVSAKLMLSKDEREKRPAMRVFLEFNNFVIENLSYENGLTAYYII